MRWVDLVAAYSPAVAMLAFLWAGCQFVLAVFHGAIEIDGVVAGVSWAEVAVFLSLHWFACRRLLQLNRWMSVGMLIVGWVVQDASGRAVFFLFKPILLW
ncbi:MAG: hypothetical protein IH989_08515 [Planctomycetes bacterium]|nr:hypothetical protein [Planctomycetota bacterium]